MYVDANIFIFAVRDLGSKGVRARSFVRDVRLGKRQACTSLLTYDELVWALKKDKGWEFSLAAADGFLDMNHLLLLDTTVEIIKKAHAFLRSYRLDPRDAIHAATAIQNGLGKILSEDKVFDRVAELERVSLARI